MGISTEGQEITLRTKIDWCPSVFAVKLPVSHVSSLGAWGESRETSTL